MRGFAAVQVVRHYRRPGIGLVRGLVPFVTAALAQIHRLVAGILFYCAAAAVLQFRLQSCRILVELVGIGVAVVLQIAPVHRYVAVIRGTAGGSPAQQFVYAAADFILEGDFLLLSLDLFLAAEIEYEAAFECLVRLDLVTKQDKNHRDMEQHGDVQCYAGLSAYCLLWLRAFSMVADMTSMATLL